MNILYIARHGCGGNDDELAIADALEMLGHRVTKVYENRPYTPETDNTGRYDFCLFHKFDDVELMRRIECPKFFWYFDLVEWPDATLESRNKQRRDWMARVMPEVTLGFCTDGEWAAKHKDKLRALRQGCPYISSPLPRREEDTDILFVGIGRGGGVGRESFLTDLNDNFPGKVVHISKGVYKQDLAKWVARSRVVVCPDSPCTSGYYYGTGYWSNRVYVLAGVGGVVLHPEGCGDDPPIEYRNRSDLYERIRDILQYSKEDRYDLSLDCFYWAIHGNLYLHRCIELIEKISEVL